MDSNLLTITAENLLEKFGAGSHKPGSGSAAAFQGMISAKLLITVISLTDEKKHRTKYEQSISKLLKMQSEIQSRIFPELVKLFQRDSVQFERTIKMRKFRDSEDNTVIKNQLRRKALKELKVSIQIPIEIAKLSIELSEIGQFVFDNAFRSARGDSQVALSGAVASLAGCISIIQLNLLSFGSDEYKWTNEIVLQRNALKLKYNELNSIANLKIEILEQEVDKKTSFYKEIYDLIKSIRLNSHSSSIQIEESTIRLQRLIWKNREDIWNGQAPDNPIEILCPSTVFKKVLGYHFDNLHELDLVEKAGETSEIAGIIDQKNRLVQISSHLRNEVQNFTAAHELGHAIFHDHPIMHRDIPMDGSSSNRSSNKEELQADKFATYFLMPKKQVRELFEQRFLTKKFFIDQNTTFNLTKNNITKLRKECKNLRGLSRKLASAESFGNEFFISIAETFNVSVEAMAIRLEEIGLLEY